MVDTPVAAQSGQCLDELCAMSRSIFGLFTRVPFSGASCKKKVVAMKTSENALKMLLFCTEKTIIGKTANKVTTSED